MRMETQPEQWTRRRRIGPVATMAAGLAIFAGTIMITQQTCSNQPGSYGQTDVIENPVLRLKEGRPTIRGHSRYYEVSQCSGGRLMSVDSAVIPDTELSVIQDLRENERPLLRLTHKKFVPLARGELHIRPGDRLPMYLSYGNAGALVNYVSGYYPCPAWQ